MNTERVNKIHDFISLISLRNLVFGMVSQTSKDPLWIPSNRLKAKRDFGVHINAVIAFTNMGLL